MYYSTNNLYFLYIAVEIAAFNLEYCGFGLLLELLFTVLLMQHLLILIVVEYLS